MRKLVILWVVSVGAAAVISAGVTAQQVQSSRDDRVLSGADIGFRVEGQKREPRTDRLTGRTASVDLLTGHLVVRVNGQWIEAEISGGGVRPATN